MGANNRRLTTEEFIQRSNEIHEFKYDYSSVEYINMKTPVMIICPEHGEYEQLPLNHIHNSAGCPVCGGTKKLTKEEFIDKSKSIFGEDAIDYSKVNYTSYKNKVELICKKHNKTFSQTPSNHIELKMGCPICKKQQKLK